MLGFSLWNSSNHFEYMGYGKVAPAPVRLSCAKLGTAASAVRIMIVRSVIMGSSCLLKVYLSVFDGRGRARQDVAQIEPERRFMSVFGRVRRDIPGITNKVGILRHPLQSTVLAIAPQSMGPPGGDFLNSAVLTVGRSNIAIPDPRAVGIQRHVAAAVNAAVIDV